MLSFDYVPPLPTILVRSCISEKPGHMKIIKTRDIPLNRFFLFIAILLPFFIKNKLAFHHFMLIRISLQMTKCRLLSTFFRHVLITGPADFLSSRVVTVFLPVELTGSIGTPQFATAPVKLNRTMESEVNKFMLENNKKLFIDYFHLSLSIYL